MVLGWIFNNKLLFFLCIALFSFMVATFALAGQKNSLASQLAECQKLLEKPPGDKPPADKPPEDKPPGDKPPAEKPPAEKPPADKPPADKPPPDKPEVVRILRKRWIGVP